MLSFIFGGADGGAAKRIFTIIHSLCKSTSSMVLLTPEQQSHRAERELARLCGPSICLHAEVLSFTRLYTRVAAQTGGLADPIPDKCGKLLLLNIALDTAAPKLRYFGERARRSDFLSLLLRTIEEFGSSQTGFEELLTASMSGEGTISDKLYDLALIIEAYNAVLKQSLGDSRSKMRRLADSIYDSSVGSGGVFIDGFTDFTAEELCVIDQLLRRGVDVYVSLVLKSEAEHFTLTQGSFHRLAALAQNRNIPVHTENAADCGSATINYLAENLFNYHAAAYTENASNVELYHLRTPRDECRLAAARIRELIRCDDTLSYSDFAVAVADYEQTLAFVESIFNEYEIPFYLGEKSELRDKSLMAFTLGALETVRGGWQYTAMFGYLKTGLALLSPEECDILENYCLMWSINGTGWTKDEDWDMNPRGFAQEKTEADTALLAEINTLRRRAAEPLIKLSADLRSANTAGEHILALYSFFETLKLSEVFSEKAQRLSLAGMQGEAEEYTRLWDILIDCLEQFYDVLSSAAMDADEFRRLLELLLSSRDIGSIPPTLDSVSIGGIDRVRMLKPRCLIVIGADDSSLPDSGDPGGLFSPDERRRLFDLGIKLMSERDEALSRQLHGLYRLAGAAGERLIISYSGGKELRPSLLITRACTLLNVPIIDETQLDDSYLASAPEPCFSLALSGSAEAELCADKDRLQAIRSAANGERGSLSERAVSMLYGNTFRLTASRAENFNLCRFMYFMQYGLKAKPRKKAGFNPPELGSFVHFVMENTVREAKQKGGFKVLQERELKAMTEHYTGEYVKQYFSGTELQNPRFSYLFDRLRGAVVEMVLDVAAELAVSSFEPLDFELNFADGGDMPAAQVNDLKIIGTVDRVDGWLDDDKLYLRVADYKTGKKQFSLSDVWYGRGIQMLIYLFVLAEHGKERYGKEIVPAGVLYSPARDILLSMPRSASEEEIAAKRNDTLRRSGLILSDINVIKAMENNENTKYIPVKFKDGAASGSIADAAKLGDLSRYVKKLLEDMGNCLRGGRIEANPLVKGKDDGPCAYCPYTEACAFDRHRDEVRQQHNIRAERFWQAIQTGGGEEGGDI